MLSKVDVVILNAGVGTTPTGRTQIATWVKAGGGLVVGGQAATFVTAGKTLASFPGNQLLKPFSVAEFTAEAGESNPKSITVPSTQRP